MANQTILIVDSSEQFAVDVKREIEALDAEVDVESCPSALQARRAMLEINPAVVCAPREMMPQGALLRARLALISDAPEGVGVQLRRADPAGAAKTLLGMLDHQSSVLGVTSPMGGSGKTSLCVGLCAAATRRGRRVFYLNLESMMGYNPYTRTAKFAMDTVIARLDDDLLLLDALKSAICRGEVAGVWSFARGERMVDRDELSAKDIERLLTALSNLCCFDHIVVDMEGCMDERMLQVWAMARRVAVVLLPSVNLQEKKRVLLRELDFRDQQSKRRLCAKALPVLNCAAQLDALPKEVLSFGATQARHGVPPFKRSDEIGEREWCDGLSSERMEEFFGPIYEEMSR